MEMVWLKFNIKPNNHLIEILGFFSGIKFRWIREWTYSVCYDRVSTVSETCCFTWRSLSRWLLKELWRGGSRRDQRGGLTTGGRETIWDTYNHISDRDRDKNCCLKKRSEKTGENAIYLQYLVFEVRALTSYFKLLKHINTFVFGASKILINRHMCSEW